MNRVAVAIVMLSASLSLAALRMTCPEDGTEMWNTGQIRTTGMGRQQVLWECGNGHRLWVAL